ncbi:unnamed protein product [marine sediment metagenome]|uniref:Lipoprotein n=1 Tax=marine sediment metagenome TaxID=412755 RepID=X1ACQ4_9ZZZZ
MRRNKLLLLLVALGVILSLAACAPKSETVEEVTPTSIPETTTTEAPEEEATTTEAPPEDMFTGSSEALKSLKSFRYLSLFKFEGEETAEIKPGSSSGFEIKAEYVAPDKEHAVWTDLSSGEGFEAIRIGDKGSKDWRECLYTS